MQTLLLTLNLVASAIFTRHDVPDTAFLEKAKQPEFQAVVRLTKAGKSIGSGVLVAPRWVLTDAHVVKGLSPADIVVDVRGVASATEGVVLHPEYESKAHSGEATALGRKGLDIALVQLKVAVAGVIPARVSDSPCQIGSEIVQVGYGYFGLGNQDVPSENLLGQARAGTNTVDAVGGDYGGPIPDWYLLCDFDSPDGKSSRMGSPQPTELECLGTGGDSGGGAFSLIDGEWHLVGVFSTTRYFNLETKGAPQYGNVEMFTRVDRISSWIKGVIEK